MIIALEQNKGEGARLTLTFTLPLHLPEGLPSSQSVVHDIQYVVKVTRNICLSPFTVACTQVLHPHLSNTIKSEQWKVLDSGSEREREDVTVVVTTGAHR